MGSETGNDWSSGCPAEPAPHSQPLKSPCSKSRLLGQSPTCAFTEMAKWNSKDANKSRLNTAVVYHFKCSQKNLTGIAGNGFQAG
jgi:hypothetical protein